MSIRWISGRGIPLMSVGKDVGSPAGIRRPLMRTSVRAAPRPRRSTVAAPVAALESMFPWLAKTCGRLLIRFSIDTGCSIAMSAGVMMVIGLVLSRFGDTGRREPVTVSFSILSAGGGAGCAYAYGADMPTRIPALSAWATASDSFFLCILFIVDPHGS